jgi:nicotinamide-nucleotide adenylyltransferase
VITAVVGRFQPVHIQHLELFELASSPSEQLIIGITNPDVHRLSERAESDHRHRQGSNPFTYYERSRMISASLRDIGVAAATVTIVPFDLEDPDSMSQYIPLDAVQFVRVFSAWEEAKASLLSEAGYAVRVVQGDVVSKLSASDIRGRLHTGTGIGRLVTPSVEAMISRDIWHAGPEAGDHTQ